jgi:AraC-like DNA-binding protein
VRRYSLTGQAPIIHPGEPHDGSNGDETPLEYLMLYVTPAVLRSATEDFCAGPLPFVREAVRDSETIRAIVAAAFEDFPQPLGELAEADLVTRLAQALQAEGGPARERRARVDWRAAFRARDLLDSRPAALVAAAQLEKATGHSRYSVARQFRAAFGISPHQYLLGRRLREARRLVAAGTALADVAYRCGFADQSHLTRCFVRRFGFTPGRFQSLCGCGEIAAGGS